MPAGTREFRIAVQRLFHAVVLARGTNSDLEAGWANGAMHMLAVFMKPDALLKIEQDAEEWAANHCPVLLQTAKECTMGCVLCQDEAREYAERRYENYGD